MPRPRVSQWLIPPALIIAPGATVNVAIDLLDTFYPQLAIQQTYSKTASTTGCSVTVYPGFVLALNGPIVYCNNGNNITDMVNPTASQSTQQQTLSGFALNAEVYPRYINVAITNNDLTNSVTVLIAGDR